MIDAEWLDENCTSIPEWHQRLLKKYFSSSRKEVKTSMYPSPEIIERADSARTFII